MSQGKDDIKKYSQPDAKKDRKPVPKYDRPDRRVTGWNPDQNNK